MDRKAVLLSLIVFSLPALVQAQDPVNTVECTGSDFSAEVTETEVQNYPVTIEGCYPDGTEQINVNVGLTDIIVTGERTSYAGSYVRTSTHSVLCPNDVDNCASNIGFNNVDGSENGFTLQIPDGKQPTEYGPAEVEVDLLALDETRPAGFAGGRPAESRCDGYEGSYSSSLNLPCIASPSESSIEDLTAEVGVKDASSWGGEITVREGERINLPEGCDDSIKAYNTGGNTQAKTGLRLELDEDVIWIRPEYGLDGENVVKPSERYESSRETVIDVEDGASHAAILTVNCDSSGQQSGEASISPSRIAEDHSNGVDWKVYCVNNAGDIGINTENGLTANNAAQCMSTCYGALGSQDTEYNENIQCGQLVESFCTPYYGYNDGTNTCEVS